MAKTDVAHASEKTCCKCKELKSADKFCKNRTKSGGLDDWCYACKTNARLIKAYGITSADYEQMFADQQGLCYLCGGPPRRDRLDIDHCHKSGKVRKLLCESCNRALGLFQDDPTLLLKASKYVQEHSEQPDAGSTDIQG